jgi:hypothetical protein
MIEGCDIWIPVAQHQKLISHLYPGDSDEHGAVLSAGIVSTGQALRLLVREVIPAIDGTDYAPGEFGYRALNPKFIHRMIVRCRDERQAYLAVHNHDCSDSVEFSKIDLASHERGYPALRDIGCGVPVGALVYGRQAVQADVWLPDGGRLTLREYRVIGSTLERLYPRPAHPIHAQTKYDRQVRMFGAAGQAILRKTKVSVIGLGGVGSLVAEYVARLGIGELILVDPDRIEETNLSRVVGATAADVEAKLHKTQIAFRHLREARPDLRISVVADDVAKRSVATIVRDCDFIFLAADSQRARLVVNALAHQYYIPIVQLGAKVQSGPDGKVQEARSVIRNVRPGHGCLWCNGLIDTTELAIEAKSEQERKDQAYGTQQPNPSVITLNAVAAAHGVNEFLFDFLNLRSRDQQHSYEDYFSLAGRVSRAAPRRDETCPECVYRFGKGDALPLPGLST